MPPGLDNSAKASYNNALGARVSFHGSLSNQRLPTIRTIMAHSGPDAAQLAQEVLGYLNFSSGRRTPTF